MERSPKKRYKNKKSDSNENSVSQETKYKALLEENELLDKQIEDFKAREITTDLKPQIKALNDYNEMKDLTQIVLGYLANAEHVSASELYKRYDLPTD